MPSDHTAHENRFERWLREGRREEGDAIPAATVVLVRDRDGAVETLMLRKNSKLAFGGMWVFPGGRIDEEDRVGAVDVVDAAARAAVREAAEETGLIVDRDSLAWFAYWIPPAITPKRFATWFFAAPAPEGIVEIDHGEIHESGWMRPTDALARRDAFEIELAPPTWMTLHYLAEFTNVESLIADADAREPTHYETRIANGARGIAAMWAGDAGYESGDPDAEGPRHRLWLDDTGWRLDRFS